MLTILFTMVLAPATPKMPETNAFEFVYRAEITPPLEGAPLEVFLPLAVSDEHQEVGKPRITAPMELKEESEPRFGNRFLHGTIDGSVHPRKDGPFVIEVRYEVRRKLHRNLPEDGIAGSKATHRQMQVFLQPDQRVPTGGPLVDKMIADLAFKPTDSQGTRARRIYDFVVDTMEYKKVGTGWGNGDTEWACTQKYGNCTDFHALFSSLARHEGIPARFEIGFPVPMDKPEGEIGGYHCWVNFYLHSDGWIPIDASEAKKDLSKRDLYFGTHPPDRVKFSVGRDLVLSSRQKAPPLNYFVYPHVEQGGARYEGVRTSFRFKRI